MFVTLEQIRQARANLAGVILPTPMQYSRTFSEWSGNTIYVKCENLQKTGAFKIRGAYNKIVSLTDEEKDGVSWPFLQAITAQALPTLPRSKGLQLQWSCRPILYRASKMRSFITAPK